MKNSITKPLGLAVLSVMFFCTAVAYYYDAAHRADAEEAWYWAMVTSTLAQCDAPCSLPRLGTTSLFLPVDQALATTMVFQENDANSFLISGAAAINRVVFQLAVPTRQRRTIAACYATIEARPFDLLVNHEVQLRAAGTNVSGSYAAENAITATLGRIMLCPGINRLECVWPYATPTFLGLYIHPTCADVDAQSEVTKH